MIFRPGTRLYSYEIVREAGQDVIYINYLGAPIVPSIADSALAMARAVDNLIESPTISRIVFVQQRNYSYGFDQVSLLLEIAQVYTTLVRDEKVLSLERLTPFACKRCQPQRYSAMRWLVLTLLKQDPIGCYVEARRLLREERINAERLPPECARCEASYLRILGRIIELLEATALIKHAEAADLAGHKVGDRGIYRKFFRPTVVPNFTFTRLMAAIPAEAELLDEYMLEVGYDRSKVTILKLPGKLKPVYHLVPPEFALREEFYSLLDMARTVLIEHRPKAEEFVDPQRTRQVFFNISRDLLRELAESKKIKLTFRQLNKLAAILVRHTIGFGLIEVLLQDDKLQDIVVNAPIGAVPIFVRHQDYDECFTNILPNPEDAESWAAKFRMLSGRPLDEANPVLDTELSIADIRARVAIIQQPLSPYGLAYAFRRHRITPWTLPLFIQNRMLNPLAAGIFSFMIDGARTLLIAGTRSSGKTSLLGSLMHEFMPKFRVICVEDVLELPIDSLRKLGYDALRMKVRSAILRVTAEMAADEGIRTSLRLGDSALVLGEIRSTEARALFEAMRVGALANVVAGTVHGADPYSVFDRIVNDLRVPITSFKAVDIIAVCNPVKSPDGLHMWKRLMGLTEVRKYWTRDPLAEGAFVDLLRYNVDVDELEPTPELINGDSEVIKSIAGNVKGWAGNWDAVWDNILLRAQIKEELVRAAELAKQPALLEAPFVIKTNNIFHEISDKVTREVGVPERKRVFMEWQAWLKSEIKRKRV